MLVLFNDVTNIELILQLIARMRYSTHRLLQPNSVIRVFIPSCDQAGVLQSKGATQSIGSTRSAEAQALLRRKQIAKIGCLSSGKLLVQGEAHAAPHQAGNSTPATHHTRPFSMSQATKNNQKERRQTEQLFKNRSRSTPPVSAPTPQPPKWAEEKTPPSFGALPHPPTHIPISTTPSDQAAAVLV